MIRLAWAWRVSPGCRGTPNLSLKQERVMAIGVSVSASAAGRLLCWGLVTVDGSGEVHFDTQHQRGAVFKTVIPGKLQGRHHLAIQPVAVHPVAPGKIGKIRGGTPARLALAQHTNPRRKHRAVVQPLAQAEDLRGCKLALIVQPFQLRRRKKMPAVRRRAVPPHPGTRTPAFGVVVINPLPQINPPVLVYLPALTGGGAPEHLRRDRKSVV